MHCLVKYHLLSNQAHITHAWKLLYKKAGEHPNHLRVVSNTSSLSLHKDTSSPASRGAILSWTRACFSWRSIQSQSNQFRHTKRKPSWFLNIKEFVWYTPPTLSQNRQSETLVPLLSGEGAGGLSVVPCLSQLAGNQQGTLTIHVPGGRQMCCVTVPYRLFSFPKGIIRTKSDAS